ncbi:MAG TPA: hypothetical protein PK600_05495 [Deltaproteobacteria bacterium]|nr:hypothetical protein [Deltaproteobacteria bacterium]
MKIIAERPEGYSSRVFIVEVSEDEAFNLVGHYNSYSTGAKKLKVGDSIKVHEMFERLTAMAAMESELNSVKAKLEAAASLIGEALPAVHRAGKKEATEKDA